MTVISHAATGGAMVALFTHNPVAIGLGAFFGALPDVAGYLDGLIRGPEYRWTKGMYGKMHQPKGLWKLLYLIPPTALHILIDKLCHKPEGGWSEDGYRIELSFWISAALAGLLLLIK